MLKQPNNAPAPSTIAESLRGGNRGLCQQIEKLIGDLNQTGLVFNKFYLRTTEVANLVEALTTHLDWIKETIKIGVYIEDTRGIPLAKLQDFRTELAEPPNPSELNQLYEELLAKTYLPDEIKNQIKIILEKIMNNQVVKALIETVDEKIEKTNHADMTNSLISLTNKVYARALGMI